MTQKSSKIAPWIAIKCEILPVHILANYKHSFNNCLLKSRPINPTTRGLVRHFQMALLPNTKTPQLDSSNNSPKIFIIISHLHSRSIAGQSVASFCDQRRSNPSPSPDQTLFIPSTLKRNTFGRLGKSRAFPSSHFHFLGSSRHLFESFDETSSE